MATKTNHRRLGVPAGLPASARLVRFVLDRRRIDARSRRHRLDDDIRRGSAGHQYSRYFTKVLRYFFRCSVKDAFL